MATRAASEITKALRGPFSAAKAPLSLPNDSRRLLQKFVDECHADSNEEEYPNAHLELKSFWEHYVRGGPQKTGLFVGALKELGPAVIGGTNILEWWQLAVKPVISSTGYEKLALEDAKEFLVSTMVLENGEESTADRLCGELLALYVTRTRPVTDANEQHTAAENAQVAHQVEDVLVALGRKRPKQLFSKLDDIVTPAETRVQAFTLLNSFLQHQAPHLYLAADTSIVEHLLKSLLNDTSTTVLSVALTSLIMLFPHIPGSLAPHLPRMFLVYTRLLCWEKFSALSTEADRSLVTDDRLASNDDSDDRGLEDVGIDLEWEKLQPEQGVVEASTPELMTYFTYLYGLYPLNFTSYIRKPRRYLKDADFQGVNAFDLDQAVIRSRTDQFRQVHLLHSNFYNMTVEEELVDPKWPRMDPADVVGECHGLCMISKPSLTSSGPLPSVKLPKIPSVLPLVAPPIHSGGRISPAVSHASPHSGISSRDTQSTTLGDSPVLRPGGPQSDDEVLPDHFPLPSTSSGMAMRSARNTDNITHSRTNTSSRVPQSSDVQVDATPQTNLAYLQQELTLMRNDLNFERWHKAQYAQHIGQIMRRNVKEATVEAETLNLINANRTLKKQLDQVRKAREATVKDSALTRKQANTLEANMTERFNKFKTEQETWQADADELRRLRLEIKQYRDLLVATEARDLNKSHQLELAHRELEQLQKLQSQLQHAKRRLHEYEYREFEFDNATRQYEIAQGETERMQVTAERHEQEYACLRQAYASKVTELEGQVALPASPSGYLGSRSGRDTYGSTAQAVAETEAKLAQLKRAHAKLLERHTDLELEYQAIKRRLEAVQGHRSGQTFFTADDDDRPLGYDIISGYDPSQGIYTVMSSSDPSSRRYQPPARQAATSPVTMHSHAGLMFEHSSRDDSPASRDLPQPTAYNQSAPLSQSESKSAFGDDGSDDQPNAKIQPNSDVRVFGRGGAQNIKLKPKDAQKADSPGGKKSSGMRGLRNFP
ncbi:hypothetical protein LTR37_007446 [Vermiconidia calcicola]|uniref:Uncharacterized protein n=1 Tax=Vermiconidia calcicola TaxID=1690605 RepID=A0ACC3NDD1_9PEZI|nr:hypothetical protein LTR37_007446 [Vermiconidia calcicola]